MPQGVAVRREDGAAVAPVELIDVAAVADSVTDQWYKETLCEVNDHLVRLGVLRGEYHWHGHELAAGDTDRRVTAARATLRARP